MCPTVNKAKICSDNWIRCVYCNHKLGKVIHNNTVGDCIVEIKCHSCKTINLCYLKPSEDIQI